MLVEMSVKGLMVDPVTNMPIVILRDAENQRVLPIWVGPVEANAIALQIENIAPPRPMTHDLLRNLVAELGATLVRVVIADLRENTFYAYLELHRGGEVQFLDARPSDAIALAIRAKAPVFVDTKVLDQARSVDVSSEQADQERLQRWLESLDPDDLGYKM
ncbi:MAG TPA: bifunctional nuclease family protein [Vicinamibacterales bacterium]|nr:bifunctional nuclease family protein [Vicinamibacterales bacterium]